MSKFKVGDRVKGIGLKGTVLRIKVSTIEFSNSYSVLFDDPIFNHGNPYIINELFLDRLENENVKRIFSDIDPYGEEDWSE